MDLSELLPRRPHRGLTDRLFLDNALRQREIILPAVDRRGVAGDLHRIALAVQRDGDRIRFRGGGGGGGGFLLLFPIDFAHADGTFALQETDSLFAAACGDEDVFVGDRQLVRIQHGDRGLAALGRIFVVDVQRTAGGRLQLELLGGDPDDFRIRFRRRAAEIAQHHLAVPFGDLLPGAEHHVVERLLEVELTHRRDRGAEAAPGHRLAHGGDDLRIFLHEAVVPQHLGVCGQRAARHREERNQRVDLRRLRRHEIVLHGPFETLFELDDLLHVDIQIVLRAAQGVPHGQDIRLAGAAGERGDGEVQLIGSAFERRMVGQNAAAGGLVRVEDDPRMVPEQVPRHPDGFVDLVGGGGSRGVLEADRIVGNAGVENPAQNGFIKLHGMADTPRGQFHHGDGDFVLQARFRNAGPAVEEVVHVVQSVEIADCGDAVLFHQLSVQLDDVARLAVEPDHVDAAGEGLEVGAVSDNAAEIIHHAERILVAVEISGLKQRAAAGLEMGDSCRGGLFHHGQKIGTEDAGAEYRLESVAEGSQHKVNFFHKFNAPELFES